MPREKPGFSQPVLIGPDFFESFVKQHFSDRSKKHFREKNIFSNDDAKGNDGGIVRIFSPGVLLIIGGHRWRKNIDLINTDNRLTVKNID
jgi:hypothetical protein